MIKRYCLVDSECLFLFLPSFIVLDFPSVRVDISIVLFDLSAEYG